MFLILTHYTQSRPFGVALLIAGVDENGPQLFHVDPSGTFMRYDAKSIGSGSEGAQTELQDSWHKVSRRWMALGSVRAGRMITDIQNLPSIFYNNSL